MESLANKVWVPSSGVLCFPAGKMLINYPLANAKVEENVEI